MEKTSEGKRRRPADRPQRILTEAARIVGLRGYYGFSIRELADHCGVTVAGVLHHFGSKEQLLIELLKSRDDADETAISDEFGPGLPTRELSRDQALGLLCAIVERNSRQPDLVRLYSMLRTESVFPEHPAHTYFMERDAAKLTGLAELVRGLVPDPHSRARQLLAMMEGLEELWLRLPGGFDLVEEWHSVVRRLLPP